MSDIRSLISFQEGIKDLENRKNKLEEAIFEERSKLTSFERTTGIPLDSAWSAELMHRLGCVGDDGCCDCKWGSEPWGKELGPDKAKWMAKRQELIDQGYDDQNIQDICNLIRS